MTRDKWIKVDAIKIGRNGKVQIRTRNPRKLSSRNVQAGFFDATGFHPLRASSDYDPDRAGDDYGARTDNRGVGKRKPAKKKKAKAKRKR